MGLQRDPNSGYDKEGKANPQVGIIRETIRTREQTDLNYHTALDCFRGLIATVQDPIAEEADRLYTKDPPAYSAFIRARTADKLSMKAYQITKRSLSKPQSTGNQPPSGQ